MSENKLEDQLHYVVARRWDLKKPAAPGNLAIYANQSDIQSGTLKEAKQFLKYVKSKSLEDSSAEKKDWAIYKVTIEKYDV